jgi:hypothetical protein
MRGMGTVLVLLSLAVAAVALYATRKRPWLDRVGATFGLVLLYAIVALTWFFWFHGSD